MQPILKLENLSKKYNKKLIVENINLQIHKGEVIGLIGPNGAGKTTVFYMIMGLIKPSSGNVFFNKKNISSLPVYKRAQLGMGYLSQEPSIFQNLTAEDNILMVLETMHLSMKKKELLKKTHEYLNELNLLHLAKKKARYLSGGERRRLEIIRSLVKKPSFFLLDEPFTNIDPLTIKELKELILMLKKRNISLLITDHNAKELFSIIDKAYLLQNHNITFEGSVQDIIENEEVKKSYLGYDFKI